MSLLLLAGVAGLLAIDAVSVGQTMVSRPLPTGLIIGFLLGDPVFGAQVGALLELQLLVVVPAGGGRYPEGSVAASVAVATGLAAVPEAALPVGVALGLLAGWLGGVTQSGMRKLNGRTVPIPGEVEVGPGRIRTAVYLGITLDFLRAAGLTLLIVGLARPVVPLWTEGWAWPAGWVGGLLLGSAMVSAGVLLREGPRRPADWVLAGSAAAIGWWASGAWA